MAGLPIFETPVQAEWIDYNGHLRDAYYALIVSQASDALMDRVGLDAAYRARTGCTLYTVEMHIHYLHEVRKTDIVTVALRLAGVDHKRIHAAFELARAGEPQLVATAEAMMLHVRQHGDEVSTVPFPAEVSAALAELRTASAALPAAGPGSRRMELPQPRRA